MTWFFVPCLALSLCCATLPCAGYSPATAGPACGAGLPYVEYEAEDAATNGSLLGPSTTMAMNGGTLDDEIAAESSGRQAVKLSARGQYLRFTARRRCNSIVLRYVIPDSPSGGGMDASLSCWVKGSFNQELKLSSKVGWCYGANLDYLRTAGINVPGYGKNPASGGPFHLYDETHALLGRQVPAGSTITLKVGPHDGAAWYVVDLVDLEEVAPPRTMPSGFVSITTCGAVAGGSDCSAAIQACVNSHRRVWIPGGNFASLSAAIRVPAGTEMRGAGMWYSELSGYYATLELNGDKEVFSDFMLDGATTNRDEWVGDNGFNGKCGVGSSLSDLWIEHEKCGYWAGNGSGPTINGLLIRACRIRDTYADGVNLNQGASHSTVTECNFRNTGDDAIASWSQLGFPPNTGNTFSHNTIQCPWRANGVALYGGTEARILGNAISDTLNYPGIFVDQGFKSNPFGGGTEITDNVLSRCGGEFYGRGYGALTFCGKQGALAGSFKVSRLRILDPVYAGIEIRGPYGAGGESFDQVRISHPGTVGVLVQLSTTGSASFSHTVVTPADAVGLKNLSSGFVVSQGAGNRW